MSISNMKLIGRCLSLAMSVMLMAVLAFAQSDNTQISGTVKDPSGAVVANAKVSIKNESRDFERSTTTNAEGYYIITQLPPGFYTVSVEANGFKTYKETAKKLDPNIPARLDAELQTGQLSETVTVTAASNQVQAETATVGKLIDAKQIENLQINGRNPLFLALLKPGVLGGSLAGNSFGLTTGGLNINGGRTQDFLMTFDGAVAVRTRSNGTSIGVADLDSTQEVQILSANYNAEYGRASGGQVRIVTKSGESQFHGAAYEYLRNAALNSNTWARNRLLNPARPCDLFPKDDACRPSPFRYNQFGYNLSGPVVIPGTSFNKDRKKLFWLFGQEWVKQRATSNVQTRVPTLRMRQGDFSELNPNSPNFNSRLNLTRYVKDPSKTGGCSATDSSGCFSDGGVLGKIPTSALSANGLALLRALPEPINGFFDASGNNFFQSRPARTDQRKETISVDFLPTENHAIKGRLQLYHFTDVSAFRGNTDRAPQIIDRPNQTLSLGWTWTLSPNWISEVLAAGSRDQVFIAVDTRGERYRRSIYGINYPYIFPNEPKEITDKIPTVDGLDGFTSLDGGPYPASSTGPIYQLTNNWTNIRGNHTFKFGGYFERAGQNDFDQINVAGVPGGTNNQNGRFVFSNTTVGGTGYATANAAIGLFDTYAEIGKRSFTPYRGHMVEWFVQDSWKATPNWKFEFGLRHSIIQPYYSLWRNMVVFDPKLYDPSKAVTQNPVNGFITSSATNLQSRYNGLLIPGNGWPDAAKGAGRVPIASTGEFDFLFRGASKSFSKTHIWNTFQPRFGFAFSIDEKSALRGGVGRFLTRLGVSDSVFLGGNPPLQPMASITAGRVDNPGGTSGSVFPLTVTTQDEIFKNPEAYTWNVSYERQLSFDTKIDIAYIGRRGLHAQRERNINQLPVGTCPNGLCPFIPGDPLNRRYNADALRPYKGFGVIRTTNNEANSTYNSFQVNLERRFTKDLGFGVAYTLAQSFDDGSAQRDVIPNAFDASNLWGPSSFDRRHTLVVNLVYQLPIFRDQSKLTGKLFGGWIVSAISQMATGTPFSIGTGEDIAGVGPGSGSQFWLVNGNAKLSNSDKKFAAANADANFWFATRNPDGTPIFTRPTAGTFSTQRFRNFLYGPGFQTHNFRMQKNFRIKESHQIQFVGEAFNWPNHPNWNGPDTNPLNLTTTFGKINSKSSERQLQFALRYQF